MKKKCKVYVEVDVDVDASNKNQISSLINNFTDKAKWKYERVGSTGRIKIADVYIKGISEIK